MMKQGMIRPFLVGAIDELATAAITLIMVLAVSRWY